MAGLLLQHGADVDVPINSDTKLTLLMQFCGLGFDLNPDQAATNLETIQFLLEYGADPNRRNKQGENAFDIANKNSAQKDEILKLLKQIKKTHVHITEKPLVSHGSTTDINSGTKKTEESDCSPIKCGCFSWYR